MTNETKPEASQPAKREAKPRDWSAFAIFAGLTANALTNFAIQAWMTFGFADEVWGMPTELSVALIAALDLFAIMFMILTYQLRGTGWPRFAATLIFLFAIGAQVAAAEMFGDHRNWTTEVRVFSVLPAVFLAASQEGVVLWRTHRRDRDQPKRPPVPPPTKKTKPETPADVDKPQVKTPKLPVKVRKPQPRPAPAPVNDKQRDAQRVIDGKATKAEIAAAHGVSTRSVENWMAALRNVGATTVQSAPEQRKEVAVLPADKPHNGHAITPATTTNGGATA